MLNKEGQRELAYVVTVDNIIPIEGADRVEQAIVGGWHIMVKKGQFQPGDLAVYFEIDSKVPAEEPFMFLAQKHFSIKTQKYFKGTVISQGLLMGLEDFPNLFDKDLGGDVYKKSGKPVAAGDFLTEKLKVKYSVAEDNKRKGSGPNKYERMAMRHSKLFKNNKIIKWLYQYEIGKKILFIFLGKKRDKRNWPAWVVKTDEERCQNLSYLFPGDETKWIVTEKIDGSSTTFTLKKEGRKTDYYVCSRNVCFDTPEKAEKCFYDSNIYLEMNEKYDVQNVLQSILDANKDLIFVTLQGETYGASVQQRTYGLEGRDFAAFNLIYGYKDGTTKRLNPYEMAKVLADYYIPFVPIIDTITLPASCEELLLYAAGPSKIDGGMREGIVLRTEDGTRSFKAVDNEFLLKYHS